MLPPGHISAGYLTAYSLLNLTHPEITQSQYNTLLALGALAGFSPDLDFFYAFFKVKSFTIQNNKINHRYFISHAPILWFIPGIIIYLVAQSDFYRYAGLLIWLGSWSHFLLDSLGGEGIMWLWPITRRNFSLKSASRITPVNEPNFFKFWWKFLSQYPKKLQLTFTAEIIVIVTAIITFIYSLTR